ncbi:hypothetical protein D3C81_2188710 [compost metagenome]
MKGLSDDLRRNDVALNELADHVDEENHQHHFPRDCRRHNHCGSRPQKRPEIRDNVAHGNNPGKQQGKGHPDDHISDISEHADDHAH